VRGEPVGGSTPEADRDDRLNEILLGYVEAIERGEMPDRDRLLDSYPEYASALIAFFATRDRLDRIAAPLRAAVGSTAQWNRVRYPRHIGDHPTGVSSDPLQVSDVGRVGDFRLLREVGRGGMGIVYEAEQVSLRRRVALKVLPFAAAIDPRHLQRFRNEAHAAAQLHHTHIVPVFAFGAEGGVHFYAMQFINGQSLAQLLANLRRTRQPSVPTGSSTVPLETAGIPNTPISSQVPAEVGDSAPISTEHASRRRDYFRRIAELIRQAADALEYAHEIGVIHRDIKPANLLFDTTGRLWVTDFGLAQIRNDVGLTATGELVGTIRYMSPEQAVGKPGLLDHRTDIYSLGVTLYELLTLLPVFDGEDRPSLLHRLADEEPRPPRALDRSIPIELETIVLKAMAKVPAERYASAREFADDLQRFLDDRPVLARRPTIVDKAAKWIRRHRGAALVAVLVLVLASIGLGVSTALIAHEHAETKAALKRERDANDRERARAQEAEDNYLRTRRAIDLFVELSDEEMLAIPPLAPVRYRLLEAAIAYYQELSNRREDASLRADLGASRDRLTRLREELDAINEVHMAILLEQPAVQTELALTSDQTARLAPLLGRLRTHQRAAFVDAKGGLRQHVRNLAATVRQEVGGVLTASQDRRLRQVFLQLPGPHIFGPALLDALGLTDQQKSQVRRIQSEAMQASMRPSADELVEGRAVQFDEVWRRAITRIVALFTPTQKARWAEMIGPPAPAEVHFPMPPPGRPR